MKIEISSLDDFALGIFNSKIVENAWVPQRLPDGIMPLYSITDSYKIRRDCTSGVRLRWKTDARQIRLGLRYGAAARTIYKGVLCVDGRWGCDFGPDSETVNWEGVIYQQSGSQTHVFDLWLPHLCRVDVAYLEGVGARFMKPVEKPKIRWLAYGDSITQGMTSSVPTRSYVGRCALELDAHVYNLGVGGATLSAELSQTIPDGFFDLISVAYGTNDFNQNISVEKYVSHLRLFISAIRKKYPECPLVLLSVLTWAEKKGASTKGEFLDDYRVALKNIPNEFEKVILVPGNEMIPDDSQWFCDQVHPNDRGFELYAQKLLPYLFQALKLLA